MVDKTTNRLWPARRRWRTVAHRWYAGFRRSGRQYLLMALGIAVGVLGVITVSASGKIVAGLHSGRDNALPMAMAPIRRGVINKHIQPVAIAIPAIGLTSNLVDLALNANETLEPPTDFQTAGWFAQGPAPGDAGGPPAVIAGHIDSVSGPAVFARLHELVVGSDIQVTGIDGVVRHFAVYRLASYAKAAFPASEVYSPTERAELRVITCTGDFDRNAGSYLSNLVIYAALAS